MEGLFLSVLNMSLTASYVILFILLVRLPLKKVPKIISYALWSVAGFRLLCPFSFESMVSLLPISSAPIPQDIAYRKTPQITSGIASADTYMNSSLPAPSVAASVNPLQIYIWIGACLWLMGLAVMLAYSILSIVLLKKRLRSTRQIDRNIYEAGNLKTPFVLGILRPKIFIPGGLAQEEKSYIIRHEQTHIHRRDHIIKPFAFLLLSIHWFNPLVWIAFVLMSTDMELSCDERVIKEMGGEIKKAYSISLLSLASEKRILNGSPLAFGEGSVKGRIKNILNYKKPVVWKVALSVTAVLAVAIGLLVNPVKEEPDLSFLNPGNLLSIISEQEQIRITSKEYGETFVSGPELAKWLDNARNRWSKKRLSPDGEQKGVIIIHIDDTADQEIRFWDSEPALALVVFGEEKRYYTIPKEDYESILEASQMGFPGVQSVTLTQCLKGVDTSSLTVTDPELIRRLSVLAVLKNKKNETLISKFGISQFQYSVNDTPSVSDYIRMEFKRSEGGSTLTYFAYSKEDKNYIEMPYSHINEIDSSVFQTITEILSDKEEDIEQGLTPSASEQAPLEPIAPEWSPEQGLGVDMPFLDYASDDIIIFHGYFGLFVYDLASLEIIRSLDLAAINCSATQGDDYCEVTVRADGNLVQLHPMSSDNMYVYTISDNSLEETRYQPLNDPFTGQVTIQEAMDVLKEEEYNRRAGSYGYNAIKFKTGEYGYLHTSDWTLGTLSYVRDDMLYGLFDRKENQN